MKFVQGPINSKALVAYCHTDKVFAKALDLVRGLYKKDKREFTGVAYWSHPTTVSSLLLEISAEPTTMAAGALQETLARGRLQPKTIVEQFGPEVLSKVEALTPVLHINGELDVRSTGERLQAGGGQVQTIKLASLLDTICAIPRNKLASKFKLLDEVDALLPYLQIGNAELMRRVQVALRQSRA